MSKFHCGSDACGGGDGVDVYSPHVCDCWCDRCDRTVNPAPEVEECPPSLDMAKIRRAHESVAVATDACKEAFGGAARPTVALGHMFDGPSSRHAVNDHDSPHRVRKPVAVARWTWRAGIFHLERAYNCGPSADGPDHVIIGSGSGPTRIPLFAHVNVNRMVPGEGGAEATQPEDGRDPLGWNVNVEPDRDAPPNARDDWARVNGPTPTDWYRVHVFRLQAPHRLRPSDAVRVSVELHYWDDENFF